MKKRLRFSLFIVLLCFVLCCCGCNGSKTDEPVGQAAGAKPYDDVTITVVSWKYPASSHDPSHWDVIEDNYGFTIDLKAIAWRDHIKTISSLIATDQQPDIIYTADYFPSALTVLQPLENSGINLDEFHNQSILKASSVNGKPYLASGTPLQYCYFDVCVYNKQLFSKANIPTPKEFYDKGEWTVEKFLWCAEKISALGENYVGVGIMEEGSIALSNDPLFKLIGGKVELGNGEKLIDTMRLFSKMALNQTAELGVDSFGEGKQGMAITTTLALHKTGAFPDMNPDHIGVALLPKQTAQDSHTASAKLCGWGIVKGSKHPDVAGLFLKEYLNPSDEIIESNEDYKNRFHNAELEKFYYEVYNNFNDDIVYYLANDIVNTTETGELFHEKWDEYSPDEIESYINDSQELMQQMKNTANK